MRTSTFSFLVYAFCGSQCKFDQKIAGSLKKQSQGPQTPLYHHSHRINDVETKIDCEESIHRRRFISQLSLAVSSLTYPLPANSRGLVQFPCTTPLLNTYHLMRAGNSLIEENDIIETNPLFLTNREAALSENGIAQVQAACQIMEENQINPSVIKYSLAASAMDTTAIVKERLKVGQNRIIPEFTFMDPRALGKWNGMRYSTTNPAIVALDEEEAGSEGRGGRPPANDDGTPNETLADQAIRLVQLLSILETQFSGDDILLIFPDKNSPALLSSMIAGVPFNKAHVLDFAPGEVRLDVKLESVLELYEQKLRTETYKTELEVGKVELERLRSLNTDEIVSRKDMLVEKERVVIEEQQQRKEEERMQLEEKKNQARIQRQQEIEASRQLATSRRRQQNQANIDSTSKDNNMLLAVGGILTAAVALLFGGKQHDITKNVTTPSNQTETNTTIQTVSPEHLTEDTRDTSKIPQAGGENEAPQEKVPFIATPTSVEERERKAAVAMQTYMDQDDGGEDWLTSMSELMKDDDDDREKVNGENPIFND